MGHQNTEPFSKWVELNFLLNLCNDNNSNKYENDLYFVCVRIFRLFNVLMYTFSAAIYTNIIIHIAFSSQQISRTVVATTTKHAMHTLFDFHYANEACVGLRNLASRQ